MGSCLGKKVKKFDDTQREMRAFQRRMRDSEPNQDDGNGKEVLFHYNNDEINFDALTNINFTPDSVIVAWYKKKGKRFFAGVRLSAAKWKNDEMEGEMTAEFDFEYFKTFKDYPVYEFKTVELRVLDAKFKMKKPIPLSHCQKEELLNVILDEIRWKAVDIGFNYLLMAMWMKP